jgi:hypothetical protein
MSYTKKYYLFVLLILSISLLPLPLYGEGSQVQKSKTAKDAGITQKPVYPSMPEPGKKVQIGSGYYLIYGFDKKPKLGMVIMKVEIFTREGKKDTSLEIKADTGMPSMRGAHETGDQTFKLSKRGDYLLPINIVMPGDWEIRLTINKDGKVIFRGSYKFDV